MKSRQSHKPRGRRKKVKKAVLQTSMTTGSSAGRAAREANLFATGIAGKYGFWRNNYLGLLALIFKQNGMSSRKQLAALTDTNDRAWVNQLELFLKSLQHPESAPLITKKQTIRQIEQLMTNAGYKVPSAQALPHTSPSPSDAAPTLLQAQGSAEKLVKKRGRKSKKQLEAEASVNHINYPDMIPQSPVEKRVKPALVNYVNKGSLPLINRSIGQIAASIGMVGSSRRNRPEQQSQAVSRHQHTTQNVNIQLKSIQFFHKSVIREKGHPSTAQAGLERSSRISHANVANHVEAVQRTSQLLEKFQEGKPAVGVLESGTGTTSARTTNSAQPSVLQIAKLYLNDVAQPHLVSQAQHQPAFEEDVTIMSSPASSPKSLPKLGEGPFTAGNAPASVHFIKSLLGRNASQKAGASINPMPPHHESGVRVDRQPKTSTSKGFLAASQLPLAINASRITSTLPFAMHAATSVNVSNEAWGSAPNSPRIWRKPEGQDQARANEQERMRVQEHVQDQYATQLHEQVLGLQERTENQAHEAQRLDQVNVQLHAHSQEYQRVQEQERTTKQLGDQEQASVQDQELHSTAVQDRSQRGVSEQIHAPNQVKSDEQAEVLQQGKLQQVQGVLNAADNPAIFDEKTLIDGAADARPSIRATGKRDQSFVMGRLARHAVKPVSGQGIPTFPGKENALSPSKLTHRKLSAIENGIEAAVKIQSNEHSLKQLLQKQRQQSSNDVIVGSTYTNLTTHTPSMMRMESRQRKQSDTINDVTSTPAIHFHPMNNPIQRLKTSSQTSANGRQLEGVLKQVWGNQPEAGSMASSVPGVGVLYPKNITSEISAKMAGNSIIKAAASPIEGYRASVKASTRLHGAERILRTPVDIGRGDSVSERQSGGQREEQDAVIVRSALPSADLASEISAKIVESSIAKIGTAFIQKAGMNTEDRLNRHTENGLEIGLPGHPAKGTQTSSLSSSSALGQRVERIFRSLTEPQGWGENEPTDRTGETAQTAQTAEIAETAETAQPAEKAQTAQAAGTAQTAEIAQTAQAAETAQTAEIAQAAQAVSAKLSTSGEHSRSGQLADDVREKEARNRTRSSLSSGDFASEIASKITKNSLKSMGPSLAPAAAEIALHRSQQADLMSRGLYQGSAVQAIWRARQREASTNKVSVPGNESRAASIKDDAGAAVSASDEVSGISQRASFEVARGTISQASSAAPLVRRMASSANSPRNERVGNSVGQADLGIPNWIGRTHPNEIYRLMEAEARAKLHIQAGSAMQSRKQPAVEARRSTQAEHVQRQTIVAEYERAQRARTGSGNQEEAGSFLSDSTERTIRASLSALEEARAQAEQPAAASRAAARADARTTRAPVARQPASMTPRVMPLLASSAGARFAAPAGGAAASPAAAVHLLPARGTGSFTQAAAIGRAAAITAGAQRSASTYRSSSASLAAAGHTTLPTQVQRQLTAGVSIAGAEGQSALQAGAPVTLLLPSTGSRSATARQEHLTSQPPTLEHKQAPAAPAQQSALAEKPLEMDWLRAKEGADQAQTPAAPISQAAPELSSEQLQELIKQLPQLDVAKIADKVFREIEKRMKFERQRRGL